MKDINIISIFFIFIIFLSINKSEAQERFNNRLDIEGGWGIHYPAKPAQSFLHKGYINLKSFYLGGRYVLNDKWSLRLTYAFNKFEGSKYNSLSLTQHKFLPEGVLDIIPLFTNQDKKFKFFLHSGLGFTLGKSGILHGFDKTLTFQMGMMPSVKISPHLALQLDMNIVFDFFQAYNINGIPIKDNFGNYYLANIGIAYYFGKN